jgi:hypothetical protein
MRLEALKRGISRFNKATSLSVKIFTVLSLCLFGWLLLYFAFDFASESYDTYKANHLTAAENLQTAKKLCPKSGPTSFACNGSDQERAISDLEKIPAGAPEYGEGSKMLSDIREWKRVLQLAADKAVAQSRLATEKALAQQKAEHDRLVDQSEEESRAQMQRNVAGAAHDAFTCGTSTTGIPIVSFDYRHYWWVDDGRCAAQQEKEREAKERSLQQQRDAEQKRRNEDAELLSYWPTTLRVNTDINSFWLDKEERTCQTYPDGNGRVAVVACDTSGSHRDHNIPVQFWGGVDRNAISSWKCRREGDNFVCRAID